MACRLLSARGCNNGNQKIGDSLQSAKKSHICYTKFCKTFEVEKIDVFLNKEAGESEDHETLASQSEKRRLSEFTPQKEM